MAIDRRLFKNFDWTLLTTALSIVVLGLPVMYSASFGKEGSGELFNEHLLRLAAGLTIMLLVLMVDYHLISRWSYLFYALNLGALIFVAVSGIIGLGARRWLSLGPVVLQPSEMCKIVLILCLAYFLSRSRPTAEINGMELAITLGLVLFPLLLILEQPDLGTAVIVFLIYLTMILCHGFSRRTKIHLAGALAGITLLAVVLYAAGVARLERFLKPYQIRRISVLFDPSLDPLGASYHITQSKIAIGSGGLMGKGFLNGTQNQLRFLPQQHTDFIFSVLAEEWGFLGVVLIIALYAILIMRGLQVAREARDRLGSLIAVGVTSLIFYHAVINIGMTVGYIPVVGLPLPLFSYGGSSFIVVMMGIGLLLNVRMRRFVI